MPCQGVHVIRPMHALVRPRKLHMGSRIAPTQRFAGSHWPSHCKTCDVSGICCRAASRTLGGALDYVSFMNCMRADARARQGPSYLRIFTGPELVKSRGVERYPL